VPDPQLHARVAVAEVAQDPRDAHARPLRLHDPEPHGAAQPAAHGVDGLAARRGRRQRGARVGEERAPGIGQPDPAGAALEQRRAELGLQPPQRRRHGGLHDVQPVRRAGDPAFLGGGDERLELPQVHAITIRDGRQREHALNAMVA
jgi:hypothetical protein